LHQLLDRLERCIDRTTPLRIAGPLRAIDGEHDARMRHLAGLRRHTQRDQLEVLLGRRDRFLRDQRLQVFVEDLALLVGEVLEAGKGGIERLFRVEFDTQLLKPRAEGIAPGQLAQGELVGGPADALGTHDLVGLAVLQHTVLVDAGLVRECIGADHRLVGLHRVAGDLADQLG